MPALPDAHIQFDQVLYDEDADGVLEWLRQLDPPEPRMMLVGHNPTLQELCLILTRPVFHDELESMGLPSPGETALVAAAVLASQGKLQIWLVILIGVASAIAGDNLGYLLGRRFGREVLEGRGPFRARRVMLIAAGDRFFERHGARAVFFARWIALVRFAAAWLAGINEMRFRQFFFWNALGGLSWGVTYGLVGYFAGAAAAKAVLDLAPQMYMHLHEIGYGADAHQLSGVRRVNCRRCHGVSGQPAWIDEREFNDAVAQAAAKNAALPGSAVPPTFGGFFDVLGEPHPDCKHCGGQGVEQPFTCDTTKLEGASRRLFVKARPDGTLELEDRQKARAELHRLLGLIIDRKDSRSVVVHVEPLKDMTPEQVLALIEQQRLLK